MLHQTTFAILAPQQNGLEVQGLSVRPEGMEAQWHNVQAVMTKPSQVLQLVNAQNAPHMLVAILSTADEAARDDPLFCALVRKLEQVYSYSLDLFKPLERVDFFPMGDHVLRETVARHPYFLQGVHEGRKVSLVYQNTASLSSLQQGQKPCPMAQTVAQLKLALFQLQEDEYFAGLSRLIIVIHHREPQHGYQLNLLLSQMQSMQAKLQAELKMQKMIRQREGPVDTSKMYMRVAFKALRNRINFARTKATQRFDIIQKISKTYFAFHAWLQATEKAGAAGNSKMSTSKKPVKVRIPPLSIDLILENTNSGFCAEYNSQETVIPLHPLINSPRSLLNLSMARSLKRERMIIPLAHATVYSPQLTPQDLRNRLQQQFKHVEKYTYQLIRDLEPLYQSKMQPPFPVFLNTYNLLQTTAMTKIGLPVLHSAVEILGVEIAFGGHQFDETGVYAIKPRSLAGAQFYRQVYIEHSYMTKEAIAATMCELASRYVGSQYDILHFNCNDFTNDLCYRLTGQRNPAFVNRAAKFGKVFRKRRVTVTGALAGVVGCQNVKDPGEQKEREKRTGMVVDEPAKGQPQGRAKGHSGRDVL